MMDPIILPFEGKYPDIAPDVFIAPGAVVIGDVKIGKGSNIWFGVVIRGDVNYIRIGEYTNVQDGTVVHVTTKTCPTIIGSNITIGHSAVLHGCTVEDGAFIGMHSTIMDRVVMQSGSMVAAGALVSPGKTVPTGELWAGNPAKLMRPMKQEEIDYIPWSAKHYFNLGQKYLVGK